MKKVFFVSRLFPFHLVIYPGSGPGFGRAYGWAVEAIDDIGTVDFDIAIIENRLTEADIAVLDRYLANPRGRGAVLFKMSDPEMPQSRNAGVRFILGKADAPGVHYLSVYEPAGPLAEFFAGLRRSRVVTAPFPYEPQREINTPIGDRAGIRSPAALSIASAIRDIPTQAGRRATTSSANAMWSAPPDRRISSSIRRDTVWNS